MQRLRVSFGRDEQLKYVSHLDMMRLWERILRRADISLAYSEGFSPHPKLSMAAPLAVGMTSVCELLDIQLEDAIPIAGFAGRVDAQLPTGLWVASAEELVAQSASLASSLRFAEYEVSLDCDVAARDMEGRVASLLTAGTLSRDRVRDGLVKRYDLRPLIDDLKVVGDAGFGLSLWMRLKVTGAAAGRPEEVVRALGVETAPRSIRRARLIFE